MFKKLFTLFKIGRKLSTSGAISSLYDLYNPPITIKILFFIIGFNFKENKTPINLSRGKKLCNALQEMGTTFIKLGQFLATRPDIIGEKVSKDLEMLQDKLKPFSTNEAKNILRKELGEQNYNQIQNLSEPVAAASIAQVHFATISDPQLNKEVAIKILRPNIEEIFNEEIDALMLLAYIVEKFLKKTKRLKLTSFLFEKEKERILKKNFTEIGGSLNLDTILKASDFANFLPNLNKVNNFLIIKFSNQSE